MGGTRTRAHSEREREHATVSEKRKPRASYTRRPGASARVGPKEGALRTDMTAFERAVHVAVPGAVPADRHARAIRNRMRTRRLAQALVDLDREAR